MKKNVKVGLIGSQFISAIHAESLARCASAEMTAVASPSSGHAEAFAARHGIPHLFSDYRKMLEMPELDMVTIGIPNDLHCEIVLANGQCVVTDQSRYGTFLNGHRIDGSAALQSGDIIRVGTPGVELRMIRVEG